MGLLKIKMILTFVHAQLNSIYGKGMKPQCTITFSLENFRYPLAAAYLLSALLCQILLERVQSESYKILQERSCYSILQMRKQCLKSEVSKVEFSGIMKNTFWAISVLWAISINDFVFVSVLSISPACCLFYDF